MSQNVKSNDHTSVFKAAEQQADFLLKNQLVPASYKNKSQVIRSILLGNSLGMDAATSVRLIDIIGDNPALQSKTIAGFLTGAGISIEVLSDWEPMYDETVVYVLGEDGKALFDENDQIRFYKDEYGNPLTRKKEIDRITCLRFRRNYPNIGVISTNVEFRQSDAIKAGWMEKNTWRTLPRFMALARCLSRGSRLIASDITQALYSTEEVTEFADMPTDMKVHLDDEGELRLYE